MKEYLYKYKNFLVIPEGAMNNFDRERLEKEIGLIVVEIKPGRRAELFTVSTEEVFGGE